MIQIIPAIDILDGKCVRLQQGDYEAKTCYHDDPIEVAKEFERYGIQHIHVVDLDGARSKHIVNIPILKRMAAETSLTFDFGGGIKTDEDIELAFANGASQVTVGSIAVQNPDLFLGWLEKYGTDRIILGADAKDGQISINGWKEGSGIDLIDFLKKYIDAGVTRVLCTDISKDGMMKGPSIELYKQIMEQFPTLKLTASGGVSRIQDIEELNQAGIHSVVTGKAIYEGSLTLEEINQFIKTHE
ncbi:MAG: 1-(5-phosphoribosyl)-5-[(5-phosphoribosylamino)methylideneamino]imidazole-4-carboxamide isomerase [Bacteroidales bacterium]|nr:1-(5-phosphoribosyl)-5-[(5-phosphoribosylamino)methylideneamino]imidazole-4-carboxamide isomerase [Candidatus Minthousia equi]